MIDINKEYTTIGGLPVRIYATNGSGDHPIHGAVFQDEIWSVTSWAKEGRYHKDVVQHPWNLVEVPALQDKDIVVAWYNEEFSERIGFYDKENNRLFSYVGDRDGAEYDNYKLAPNPSQRLIDLKSKLKD